MISLFHTLLNALLTVTLLLGAVSYELLTASLNEQHKKIQKCNLKGVLGFLQSHQGTVFSSFSFLWHPRSRVQTRPKPSEFSGEKLLSTPSFGGEVKPSVPCRGMLRIPGNYVEFGFSGEICRPFLAHFRSPLPEGSRVT